MVVSTVDNSSSAQRLSGRISGGGTVTQSGSDTLTLSGNNTYSGGTTVTSGTVLASNTSGSATGTGSFTVSGGATIGGYGTSAGSSFTIGSATGPKATVLAGLNSATDPSVGTALTLTATSSGTIQNANLTFNIDSTEPGNSSQLDVGGTAVTFGASTETEATTLSLRLQGLNTVNGAYVLIAGTDGGDDQFSGLSLGTSETNGDVTITPILNSGDGGTGNLTLAFATPGVANEYAPSYLFLYQNSRSGADDIEAEVIPEPSTWAMLTLGLGLLIFASISRPNQGKRKERIIRVTSP